MVMKTLSSLKKNIWTKQAFFSAERCRETKRTSAPSRDLASKSYFLFVSGTSLLIKEQPKVKKVSGTRSRSAVITRKYIKRKLLKCAKPRQIHLLWLDPNIEVLLNCSTPKGPSSLIKRS